MFRIRLDFAKTSDIEINLEVRLTQYFRLADTEWSKALGIFQFSLYISYKTTIF